MNIYNIRNRVPFATVEYCDSHTDVFGNTGTPLKFFSETFLFSLASGFTTLKILCDGEAQRRYATHKRWACAGWFRWRWTPGRAVPESYGSPTGKQEVSEVLTCLLFWWTWPATTQNLGPYPYLVLQHMHVSSPSSPFPTSITR